MIRNSVWQAAMLSGFVLGLESCVEAQQAPAWSPQPFSKPQSESTASNDVAIPRNSLRPSTAPQETDVLRWRSINLENRDTPETKSYSQSVPSNSSGLSNTQRVAASSKLIRQPQSNAQASAQSAPLGPRSGFNVTTQSVPMSQKLPATDSKVQLASYSSEPATNNIRSEAASNGVWYDRSVDSKSRSGHVEIGPSSNEQDSSNRNSLSRNTPQRSTIQKARYQEPANEPVDLENGVLSLPPAKENLPEVLQGNRQPLGLGDSTANEPPRMPLPKPKSKGSLLDPAEEVPPSPFPGSKSRDNRSPSDSQDESSSMSAKDLDRAPAPPKRSTRSVVNCDSLRQLASESDITKIRVDSSPNFVEGYKSRGREVTNTKEAFIKSAPIRTWNDLSGNTIAEGKLVDISLGMVVIERADGTRTAILMRKLSEQDQVYIGEKWGIPVTCSVDDGSFPSRDFVDTTVTWKATGACHKPLYFEEMQLERYGHEWGPLVQPAISSAHFFTNVAFLPYKMGIHPMNECQYSLGYYRPGSCAPWTVGPIPISLRGALMQAKVVTGTVLALP